MKLTKEERESIESEIKINADWVETHRNIIAKLEAQLAEPDEPESAFFGDVKKGEWYWCVGAYGDLSRFLWECDTTDKHNHDCGNCFRDTEAGRKAVEQYRYSLLMLGTNKDLPMPQVGDIFWFLGAKGGVCSLTWSGISREVMEWHQGTISTDKSRIEAHAQFWQGVRDES